jgi:integrase
MAKDYLWQRGRQWYLRLPVPKPLRSHFLSGTGKPIVQIVQPLGSSYEYAKLEHDRRVAKYRELFARLHAGEQLTPEQVKAAMTFDAAAEGRRLYQEALTALRAGVDADTVFGRRLDAEADELVRRGETDPDRARHAVLVAKLLAVNARSGELLGTTPASPIAAPTASAASTGGETVSQAAAAWIKEMTQDKAAAPRQSTVEGHRQRVQVFVDKCGDLPLTEVTRAAAADFLAGLNISNRTRNIYATTLKCVFESARKRGRFTGENPFAGQRSKVAKNHKVRYTVDELQMLFDKLPRELAPKKHTPETAVPWVALIAAYSGACLEEICQLTVADVREEGVNGGRLWCFDIHNGDDEHKVKNEVARPRLLPIHSALVRAGLLDYIANLPNKRGQLFPGLKRRASKDNKFGPRVGELYNKKLLKLGIKQGKGKDFHSFRHTVSNVLEIAGVSQTDAARVLGHSIEGMSYGTYSQPGPGLVRAKDLVEKIKYEGLRL